MIKLHKEQRRRSEKDNRDRRNRDQDFRDPEDMHRLSERRKSSRKVDGFGGDHFSGPYDDKDALKSECLLIILTSYCIYVMCCTLPFLGVNNRVYLQNLFVFALIIVYYYLLVALSFTLAVHQLSSLV